MSHSVRGLNKNYVNAAENSNFQFSIHVTINHPSITVTWCVFRAIFYLFTRRKPAAKNNPQINYRGKVLFGKLFIDFQEAFSSTVSCFFSLSHSSSVNQKALYHNFLFFPSLFQIAITNKNTCVKLKDTQNSHLDWWSTLNFFDDVSTRNIHEILMSFNRFSQFFLLDWEIFSIDIEVVERERETKKTTENCKIQNLLWGTWSIKLMICVARCVSC